MNLRRIRRRFIGMWFDVIRFDVIDGIERQSLAGIVARSHFGSSLQVVQHVGVLLKDPEVLLKVPRVL